MLETKLKTQLMQYLTRLTVPVRLEASVDSGAASQQLLALLEEIAACSPLLTVQIEAASAAPIPSFSLNSALSAGRIRFAGLPLGHEFSSLVLALLQAGGHPVKTEVPLIARIQGLAAELVFETYISISCQLCPDVVQALNLMALLNPRITHTMIDGALFQPEVEARGILSVPTVYLNGEPFSQGSVSLEQILAKLDRGTDAGAATTLTEKPPFDVLVVGGGPAGVAAAVYAARKGIRTGLVTDRLGGQLHDTLGVENFITVVETEGAHLARGLEAHASAYEIDVMRGVTAANLALGPTSRLTLSNGATLSSRALILATGARWRDIKVPGEAQYHNRGVAYCPHCDGPLYKGKTVAVIGGGNSGVEAAIDLAGIVKHVTLLEYDTALRADAVLQRKLASLENATVLTNAQTLEIVGNGERVSALRYRNRASGEETLLSLAGVFVQIGLVPNTDWLEGTLARSPSGEIEIDARGQTSVPGIYAAGDCTTVPFKQIVIAIGEGAKAALGAFDYLIRTPIN